MRRALRIVAVAVLAVAIGKLGLLVWRLVALLRATRNARPDSS